MKRGIIHHKTGLKALGLHWTGSAQHLAGYTFRSKYNGKRFYIAFGKRFKTSYSYD